MAEGCTDINQLSQESKGSLECAVCLQTCIHPAMLPCGHVFCFLCVKGIANQSRKCAMCRQEIPRDYLDHPKLLEPVNKISSDDSEDDYQWFYEGRNGWWKYDERTNEEIEAMFQAEVQVFEILICGELYIIDFLNNIQFRKKKFSRRRAIKRDTRSADAIGIAGCAY